MEEERRSAIGLENFGGLIFGAFLGPNGPNPEKKPPVENLLEKSWCGLWKRDFF